MYLDPSQPSGLTTIENRNQIRHSSFYSAGLDQHHNQFKPNKDGKDANGDERVGKCHGYDGYIRVKKLASWGKKFGRPK